MTTKTIQTPMLYRSAELTIQARDPDDPVRIDLAFSSETPVSRFFGDEILDHDPSSVRLERMNGGAPLLVGHDPNDHVGRIETASIDGDRVGRATARLGRSERAIEIARDVMDGIRHQVSVGYRVHRMVLEEASDEGPDRYRATDWEPMEVSLVSVPADATVGVGRDAPVEFATVVETKEEKAMPDPVEAAVATADDVETRDEKEKPRFELVDSPEVQLAGDVAREAERKRCADISATAKMYPGKAMEELAERAIRDGMVIADFQRHAMPLIATKAPVIEDRPLTELGMEKKEIQQFSLMRWCRAMMYASDQGGDPRKIAPFEIECSDAVLEQLRKEDPDREVRGLLVPYDVQQRAGWVADPRVLQRAFDDGLILRQPMTTTSAAGLVGTDHLAANFIEALRPFSVLLRAGAIQIPGLVGNVDIPKQTGRAAFTWVAEDGDSVDSETPIGKVTLTPKTVTSSVPITRRLMKQSAPPVEQIVRNDLVLGAAEAIDVGGISGGANAPTGIVNETGVGTVTTTGGAGVQVTWDKWVEFETVVAAANALRGMPVYAISPALNGDSKTTLRRDSAAGVTTVTPAFVQLADGSINGYGSIVSTHLNTDEILFGDYAQVLMGLWGVLDLMADTATKAASGGLVLRAFQDVDVTVRHAEAFAKLVRGA